MALTGKLEADFSDFYAAAKKAEDSLRGMENAAGRTQTSLSSFSTTTTTTAGSVGTLSQAVGSVDRILATFGVNIGSQLGALRELESLAGLAGTSMGALGTATGIAAAAFGAFKITQWVRETYDLDNAIAALASEYMGWGNVLSETAKYRVEELSRASINAGRSITSMTEAAQINADAVKKMGEAQTLAAKAAEAAWKKAKAESDAIIQAGIALGDSLLGKDVVEKAEIYLGELRILREDGLEPLRSKHEEIVGVMKAAQEAMINLGRTGSQAYRDIIAELDRFTDKAILASSRVPGVANLINGPGAVTAGTTTGAVRQSEADTWADRLAEDVRALDLEVAKYYELQGVALADTARGADRAADSFRNLQQSVSSVAAAMTQSQWLSQKPAGLSVTDYLQTRGPALQGLTVNINAAGAFLNTPTDQQRLAQTVGDAVMRSTR